uniref:non-specific serine/threonine protein kinase n=1 Tax=Manihot esculenta TaxID=3983 RepID=A0A2C9V288_MANES
MELAGTSLAPSLPSRILHFHLFFLIFATILCFQPAHCLSKLGNETDKLALLQFKAKISNDPNGILSSWNDSVSFCKWQGVTCGSKHQRVTSLNLQGLSLSGTISPHAGNLTFLRFLSLGDNRFHGEIPQEVGYLFRLGHFNLSNNQLGGEIPGNISSCSELRLLDLINNNLVGKVPAELGSLKKLVILFIGENSLTGKIPNSLGNLSSLQMIYLAENHLQGKIPNEFGQLTSLTLLELGVNNLSGMIPPPLYNISSITSIGTTFNQLSGSLPANIGLTLPNLEQLFLAQNEYFGSIPESLANASRLRLIDISNNSFTGQFPTDLGYLKGLESLHLEFNFFGSNTSQDLSFLPSLANCSNLQQLYFDGNNFGGALPSSIGNLSNLVQLGFGRNPISGTIPEEVGSLVNLYRLDMDRNLFSGSIPISFGKLQKLERLTLNQNLLSGEIPAFLGNITNLYWLQLEGNRFQGNITPSLGNCENLRFLDVSRNKLMGSIPKQIFGLSSLSGTLNLSQNSLSGSLPSEVGNLKSVNALDVSENKIYGEIPKTIGDCSRLEILYMQGNFLQGAIPSSFDSLRGLQQIDLSRNNLSGNIPKELEKLFFLKYLNLSFNNLEGEVPKTGVFKNASAFSLIGNRNLCGGIAELQLPACPIKEEKDRGPSIVIVLTTTISSFLFVVIAAFLCLFYWQKSKNSPTSSTFTVDELSRISYGELLKATDRFSSENLIGQGSFGSVYKGTLDQQGKCFVAIKVLNLQQHGASKSFIAECKALKNIRHRNLVKILTYCSSIDFKGNDFKALVFNFMENGSLEIWLHPEENGNNQTRKLNFLQRLYIAIDVASALHYLHDHCETPIVHCDLKPSNILLDSDMTAHVGDFGLAKLLAESANSPSQSQTLSTGIKGTIGYMAPEYGVGSSVTTYGDVYSFGILLLEMFTGKRPTHDVFTDGLDLHNFVKAKLPRQVMQVVDPTLLTPGEVGAATAAAAENMDNDGSIDDSVREYVVSVLQIGLKCSTEVPKDRMSMKDATSKLNDIKDTFLHRHQKIVQNGSTMQQPQQQ